MKIPEPLEAFDLEMDDGAPIRVRRHGRPDARVRVFVSHGNGFATDGYLAFWDRLRDDFDVIVFDMRNHGQNPPSDPANHHYPQMARDMERILSGVTARLGAKPTVGAFHSMSARAAMKQAVEDGWIWDALVLFDPPNVPLPGHPLYDDACAFEHKLVDWASNREARYADPAALEAEYAAARPHRKWVAGAHGLMARAQLRRDDARGDWVLVCPPALEASIYQAALTLELWPTAAEIGGPVKLVGADPDIEGVPPTGKANRAIAAEGGYAYEAIPGTGHMLQIERPEECVRSLVEFLRDCGLAGS